MATMFWLITACALLAPMPPMPTTAMFTRSLGGVKPGPRTWRGTIIHAVAAAPVAMNSRRVAPLDEERSVIRGNNTLHRGNTRPPQTLSNNQGLLVFELGASAKDLSQRHHDQSDNHERAIDVDPSRNGQSAVRRQPTPHGD
jgi:hypothetical protein